MEIWIKLINQSIDRWVMTGNPEHKEDFKYLLEQIKKPVGHDGLNKIYLKGVYHK